MWLKICSAGCDCNVMGTIEGLSTCEDETGICTCDTSQGYSGGNSGKCNDCLDGWYWTTSDSTCTSKKLSYFIHIVLRIICLWMINSKVVTAIHLVLLMDHPHVMMILECVIVILV